MALVDYPLALLAWERATAAVKPRPGALADGLKSLKKLFDAIDFGAFEIGKLATVKAARERSEEIDAAIERRLKPIDTQARAVAAAADKWLGELKKAKPPQAAAVAATDAASGGATTLQERLTALATSAKAQIAKRVAELEASESKSGDKNKVENAQHRLRLRAKVIESLRIVKNRPDRVIRFVVCAANRECLPCLGLVAGSTQKALLKTVMKGDTGMKFYYGRCVYEESCYVFVGLALPSALRKRLEAGLLHLTGTVWRVRVRSGTVQELQDDDD